MSYSRKKYLVKKGLQLKFILTIFLMIGLIAAVLSVNFYFFGVHYIQTHAEESQADYQNFARLSHLLSQAFDQLKPRLFILLVSSLSIIFFIGLFFSHQVAGPVFKLENSLARMAKGDLSFRFFFRKSDGLEELAYQMNSYISELRETIRRTREISTDIQKLSQNPELKKKAQELQDLYQQYVLDEDDKVDELTSKPAKKTTLKSETKKAELKSDSKSDSRPKPRKSKTTKTGKTTKTAKTAKTAKTEKSSKSTRNKNQQ